MENSHATERVCTAPRVFGLLIDVCTRVLLRCCLATESGVPVLCWFGPRGTKGALKVSRDGMSLTIFDYKYPFMRKKKKFGAYPEAVFAGDLTVPGGS